MNLRNELIYSQGTTYKKDFQDTFIEASAKIGVIAALSLVSRLRVPGTDVNNLRWASHYTLNSQPLFTYSDAFKAGDHRASVRQIIWNAIKAGEEQLFKIPRTFSASTLYGSTILKNYTLDLPESLLEKQLARLNILSEGQINQNSIKGGLKFVQGKIIDNAGNTLLKNAYLLPGEWGLNFPAAPEGQRPNRYLSRFAKSLFEEMRLAPPKEAELIIGGGNSIFAAVKDRAGAFTNVAIQNYMKLLDDPFEVIGDLIKGAGVKSNTANKYLSKASDVLDKLLLRNQFGVGGKAMLHNRSSKDLLRVHALRGVPKFAAMVGGIMAANATLKFLTGTDLKGIGAQVYQDTTRAYALASDVTGFTALNDITERHAPGFHNVSGLLALPASMAIFGATAASISSLIQKTPIGTKPPAPTWFNKLVTQAESMPGFAGKAFGKLGLSKVGKVGAFAAIGAAIGGALMAPFAPGAFGSSKTLGELNDLYSGEEMVPVRRGRFWEFGCVKEDTQILTRDGIKEIIDIQEGDEVLTHEGEWKQVYACVRQPMDNKRLFKMRAYYTPDYIEITGNHEVPSWIKGEIKDRYVYDLIGQEAYVGYPIIKNNRSTQKEIRTASLLNIDNILFENEKIILLQNKSSNAKGKNHFQKTSSSINSRLRFTKEMGRFIGLFLAEGNIFSSNQKAYGIEFVFNASEENLINFIVASSKKLFDTDAIVTIEDGNYKRVRIFNRLLGHLFEQIFGYNKDIPEWMWHVDSDEFYRYLIGGLIDGDGHVMDKPVGQSISLKSKRYSHILFIRNLSLRAGIIPSIQKSDSNGHIAYNLKWIGSEAEKIEGYIASDKSKRRKYLHNNKHCQVAFIEDNTLWLQIKQIEETEAPEFVYDLAVEDHKTYTTAHFTIHNTSPFEGTDIDYYLPHWTVRAKTDARKKGILPEQYYNNPIRRVLARMADPYYLERALDKERPYTYWGSADLGLGFVEKLFNPIKEVFKPTILANPEGLEGFHPSLLRRTAHAVPESIAGTKDGLTTRGFLPEVERPGGVRDYVSSTMAALEDMFGIEGFMLGGFKKYLTGGQSFITPSALHESSGRILSAQRAFWDAGIGGGLGNTEGYRRLNPDRPYSIEYISAPIRNTQPSWMPEELQFGDPFSQIQYGELRLPGRGYEALYPYLKGTDYEEYPAVHKMAILNDIDPSSPQFYRNKSIVEDMIATDRINDAGIALYERTMRQRKAKQEDANRFFQPDSAIGNYALALKKLGRSLPTESLYPLSPMHKFGGPVDPLTEYKSNVLLDKQFKLWQNPISDYIRPAFNRTVDMLSVGADYIPGTAKENAYINSYFSGLQSAKNEYINAKAKEAAEAGDYELASYYKKGYRDTIYGKNPYDDVNELIPLLPKREQKFVEAFLSEKNNANRNRIVNVVSPEMQQILSAQYHSQFLFQTNDWESLEAAKESTASIQGTPEPIAMGRTAPGRDFTGWAPGVDLNALKVKTINNMGKNIRDFNLWREDEKSAMIYDSMMNATNHGEQFIYPMTDRALSRRSIEEYATSVGVVGAQISAVPTLGPSVVDMHMTNNNKNRIKDRMREEGWISTL